MFKILIFRYKFNQLLTDMVKFIGKKYKIMKNNLQLKLKDLQMKRPLVFLYKLGESI